MKVCLMLSGLLRDNTSFASLQKYIMQPYAADVYCQSWYTSEQNKLADERVIMDCYKPKVLLQQQHLPKGSYADLVRIHGNAQIYYQGYSQLHALQTVSNMFNWADYDFIIRARYDKINILKFPDLNKLDVHKFYAGNRHPAYMTSADWFMDLVFIMPNMMQSYCSIFDIMHDASVTSSMYNWPQKHVNYFYPEFAFRYCLHHLNFEDRYIRLSDDEFLISPA